jgi:hypothetical protein
MRHGALAIIRESGPRGAGPSFGRMRRNAFMPSFKICQSSLLLVAGCAAVFAVFSSVSSSAEPAGVMRLAESSVAPASDDADDSAYRQGLPDGSNGGKGLKPWIVQGGTFVGTSANHANATCMPIDVNNRSWGLFGPDAKATRPFEGTLQPGDQVAISFSNGWVNDGERVGLRWLDASGNVAVEFSFLGGGKYEVIGSETQQAKHNFTADGMRVTFTLESADTFKLHIHYQNEEPREETFTGNLKPGTGPIDRIQCFNANTTAGAERDAFFNSLMVKPAGAKEQK